MTKASVIVPVYNAGKYLEECLDSVIHQTYKDFEVILVNDGSADESGENCDRFAEQDIRIRVIHKEKNEGLIAARRDGLKAAEGDYVAFVDADDWVERDFLEIFIRQMEAEQADIVITGCIKEKMGNAEKILNNIEGVYGRGAAAQGKVLPLRDRPETELRGLIWKWRTGGFYGKDGCDRDTGFWGPDTEEMFLH